MNTYKVNIALEFQKELDILKAYNNIISKYQELQNNIIKELSKFSTLMLENKFEYLIFKNIDIQLKCRSRQQYLLNYIFVDKSVLSITNTDELTLSQLCSLIAGIGKNDVRIITDEKEFNSICKFLKLKWMNHK